MTATTTAFEIIVSVEAGGWAADSEGPVGVAAAAALESALVTTAAAIELGITLSDDATVRELNREHRGQDKPTNVLSFPLCDADGGFEPEAPGAPLLLGDVILAYETVAAEAAAQGKRLADHTAHLVVHGVLHLLGHDHATDADADAMEQRETAILAGLGIADPYTESPSPEFSPADPAPVSGPTPETP
jgi:probable rRNA maturation factor